MPSNDFAMTLLFLQWSGAIAAVSGSFVMSQARSWSRWAWPLWIASNAALGVFSYFIGAWGLVAQQIVFLGININGCRHWWNKTPNVALSLDTFQSRVDPFMQACFGSEIASDVTERNHRFLEESLEYVQSTGCTRSEAHQLVDYVFGRPVGEPIQEAGGVAVTFAALCNAIGIRIHDAAELELARVWTIMPKIRAKQAAKPKHSPLPEA